MKKWNVIHKSKINGNINSKKLEIRDDIAQIMLNRNVENFEDMNMYINPDIKLLRNPFLLKDMKKSVERIKKAISNNEKILIYGDYDVDGVSSTSILMLYFKNIGYDEQKYTYYIPNRLLEGYGLNKEAVYKISKMDVDLIITVDCGITSIEEVNLINELGMDVIITDHHECQEKLPNSYSIVNHKQLDCNYPFKGLCGGAIAFKLVQAMMSKENFEKELYNYIEIAALATVCDIMPLIDENRIIVKNGLDVMKKSNNLGIKELLNASGIDVSKDIKIKSSHLGFGIGPRINAAGRLGQSNLGVELFTTNDIAKAKQLAEELNDLNEYRQSLELEILNSVEEQIKKDKDFDNKKIVVAYGKGWQHGVIGIVASRITEKYYKPSILLGIDENGMATGSARSIKNFDIFENLNKCKNLMEKFGGHEQAAGMSIKEENLSKFKQKIEQLAFENIDETSMLEKINIEYEIKEQSMSKSFIKNLNILEPFGMKNATPIFMLRNCRIKNIYAIGKNKNHLKLTIEKDGVYNCIGFRIADFINEFEINDMIDIAFNLDLNVFRGVESIQLIVKDIKSSLKMQKKHNVQNFLIVKDLIENIIIENIQKDEEIDLNKQQNMLYNSIINRTNNRFKYVLDEFEESTLCVVNTINGYLRAKSDMFFVKNEKNQVIFLSNIDKINIKRYNKIIVYDYVENYTKIKRILNKNIEIVLNVDETDFSYLKKQIDSYIISRDDLKKVYLTVKKMDKKEINISLFYKNLNINFYKIWIILNVFYAEKLIEFKVDEKNETITFNILKTEKKIDINESKIIKKLLKVNRDFYRLYNL